MESTDFGCSYSMDDSYKSHSGTSLNYSTDINAISVDLAATSDDGISSCTAALKYLPPWPAVNLEFRDLSYQVPDADQGE